MRKLFAIVAACLMSMGANAACGDNYDELYTNLPFEMNKVTRPQFPDNEVNLRDFGAVGDGSSLLRGQKRWLNALKISLMLC